MNETKNQEVEDEVSVPFSERLYDKPGHPCKSCKTMPDDPCKIKESRYWIPISDNAGCGCERLDLFMELQRAIQRALMAETKILELQAEAGWLRETLEKISSFSGTGNTEALRFAGWAFDALRGSEAGRKILEKVRCIEEAFDHITSNAVTWTNKALAAEGKLKIVIPAMNELLGKVQYFTSRGLQSDMKWIETFLRAVLLEVDR
ncbi:MAG: hypothetical protein ACYCX4_06970 [Bacillota bacterium]